MRVVFMGTGEIAIPTLRHLLDLHDRREIELAAVYTQPDKPVGRKQILTPPEVKRIAEERGIAVRQPERLRGDEAAIAEFAAFAPDLAVVMAYGQILPKALIRIPAMACVNLHASILPRHRGASPIQSAIRAGDSESGITLMHVSPRLDAGDIILIRSFPIAPEETGGSLHDRLAALGPEVIHEGIERFRSGTADRTVQDESLVTHSGKLERADGEIDWSQPAESIERLVRAYDPWPGTTTGCRTGEEWRRLKLYPPVAVVVSTAPGAAPGEVIAAGDRLVVQCGEGALELRGDLQQEGRRRLPVAEFLRGSPIPVGTLLGRDDSGKIAL
ncbi:MAG TPA: methionyl-tRNA formyltransferase [Bacteroidia bacterium]|nr:methionyl-tRNA formyltransferase [Bacteroidia bacterium]